MEIQQQRPNLPKCEKFCRRCHKPFVPPFPNQKLCPECNLLNSRKFKHKKLKKNVSAMLRLKRDTEKRKKQRQLLRNMPTSFDRPQLKAIEARVRKGAMDTLGGDDKQTLRES